MSEERRTIKSWAHRLSSPDEPLTREEAQLLATIAGTDRLLELVTAMQDIQMRLCRLEAYIAPRVPGYGHRAIESGHGVDQQ